MSSARRTLAPVRRLWLIVLLTVIGLLLSAPGAAADGATVEVVQLSGPLDRSLSGQVFEALDGAAARGSALVVIELDSPGGLGRDGIALAAAVADSPVPVAVWVGPPGARAGGAATVLAHAAHVLITSPASVLGPAVPLDLADSGAGGEADVADLLGGYAAARGLDVDRARSLAEGAAVVTVPDGQRVEPTADALPWSVDGEVTVLEAAEVADSGAAAFAVQDLPDVLFALDGRTVVVADAEGEAREVTIDLDPVTAQVRFDNLGLLDQILHALTDPRIVYVLLVGGALALIFELFQPGFGVAGIAGGLVALAGLYGLWVLPVAGWAVLALLAGLALLAVDLALARLGVLTIAGSAAFAAGSWWLFDGPPPVAPPTWLLLVGIATTVLFFVVLMTVVLRTQSAQEMAGAEATVGHVGVVRSMLNPAGHVFVDGALWRARTDPQAGRVTTGTAVRVTAIDPTTSSLLVEVVEEQGEASASSDAADTWDRAEP